MEVNIWIDSLCTLLHHDWDFTLQGIGADFARAYLSNVCAAKELHRNGLAYDLISEAKLIAEDWGNFFSPINFKKLSPGLIILCALGSWCDFVIFQLSWAQEIENLHRVLHISGISDLYVHVAVDNAPAKNLYIKSGFTLENEEPAWQARFLDRPRRLLLWTGLPITYDL